MWIGSLQAPYPELSIDRAGVTVETDPSRYPAIDRYGVAPVPVGDATGAQNTTPATSVACAVISAGSQNPQAAWKWITYLTNYWYGKNEPLLSSQVISPSRISVADSSGYWQALPAEAVDSVNFALSHSFNAQGGFYEKNQIVYQALDRVFAGQASLSDALSQAQAEIAALPEPVLETIHPFIVPAGESVEE
jgi:ABC-type glycerol-3-phosphate transport system substrate-binding protein